MFEYIKDSSVICKPLKSYYIVMKKALVLDTLNTLILSPKNHHYNKKEQASQLALLLMTTVLPTNWNWLR